MKTILLSAALIGGLCTSVVAIARDAQRAEPVLSSPNHQQRLYVTIPAQGLEAYAQIATEIVHARVAMVAENVISGGMPTSRYTLDVLDAVKGTARATIDVYVAGGQVGGRSVIVSDAPRLVLGEEIVAFLWTSPQGEQTGLLGLGQGLYRVTRDANGVSRVRGMHADGIDVHQFVDDVRALWASSIPERR